MPSSQLQLLTRLVQETGQKTSREQCFIVMELMFTNLQDAIHGSILPSQMSYSLILRISLDVVNGLDHLHRCDPRDTE